MMKQPVFILGVLVLAISVFSCRTVKQINKVIAPKDTTAVNTADPTRADSLLMISNTITGLNKNYIDFRTFNAKIKVDYQDNKGKQPDVTAIVRIVKDSAIWISLTASILNIEIYRVLVKKDSVILLNKQEKVVQYHSLDYLQEVTQIPFDYKTLQDLLVGNPIFLDSSNIVSYKKTENQVLLMSVGLFFKHLLTLSPDDNVLQHSKLDDVDMARNRTADITYSEYESKNGYNFSTYREITVSEKNKLDISLKFRQYEFNKELSVSFNIPKNYTRK
ncbi:MAG: DUF4292 domain-containing protein [Ferruginibacter sp.]|nr:DUF4292 domain-containing protein [Ferruginibacter sp.]MBU9935405.1 DUF4292 domain-containing protein [Ferruginibacter sp.]